jgi:ATP-binding cassette, subfamily B, bacterial
VAVPQPRTQSADRPGPKAKLLNSQTLAQISQLLAFLPRQRLRGLALLLAVSLLVGLLDLTFVGLLARLVGTISGSKLQDKIPKVFVFGGDSTDQGLWLVGVLLVLVWATTGMKYWAALIQSMLSAQIWTDYGERIFANVLLQPYEYFQTQNTAHILARLNRILSRISDDIILPILAVVSNALSAGVLTLGILVAFGIKALVIFGFLFGAYTLSSHIIAPQLRFASQQKLLFSMHVNSLLMESTRSIRDVQLYGAERYYIERFESIGNRGKKFDRLSKLLPDVPRYVIEPAGVTLLFAMGLLPALLQTHASHAVHNVIPTLAAIMFAALRLSAPIQAIFRSVSKLRGGLPEITDALELLKLVPSRLILGGLPTSADPPTADTSLTSPTPNGVMPRHSIRLEQVWYRYPEARDWVIRAVNLTVPIGSRVALVGQTGGGKTTAAHLLLGLLAPNQGRLLLDGVPLTEAELPAWQACCAIVPQNIVLLDASIRCNVAFGVEDAAIDEDRVWEALEMAQLDEFISELPYGLYTVVGEDGMRLSGGQRQRLALARAFYKKAKVLILDEATSALDNKTESDVLEALELVGRRCTTVVVAHRLSTIRYCDRIFEFERGVIKAAGDYQSLQERSASFRQLVSLQDG